jgi:hypothetical protein
LANPLDATHSLNYVFVCVFLAATQEQSLCMCTVRKSSKFGIDMYLLSETKNSMSLSLTQSILVLYKVEKSAFKKK